MQCKRSNLQPSLLGLQYARAKNGVSLANCWRMIHASISREDDRRDHRRTLMCGTSTLGEIKVSVFVVFVVGDSIQVYLCALTQGFIKVFGMGERGRGG